MQQIPRLRCGRILAAMVLVILTGNAIAQHDVPPLRGGTTYALGMPPVYKGRAGFEFGWYRPRSANEVAGLFNAGVSRDLGSPVVGIAALRMEGYVGYLSGRELDGGGRALFEIPSFHLGFGTDYNASDEVFDFLFSIDFPVKRGGLFGRGTTLAVRWLPTRDQTLSVGVNVPLWGRNIGATRPERDSVRLTGRNPARLDPAVEDADLRDELAELGERARWVTRLGQPFAEATGADPQAAMAPVLSELQQHVKARDTAFPDGHSYPEEIRVYHEILEEAFTLAEGGDATLGARLGAEAREILLDEVILPYNRLLGQRKTDDSLVGFIAVAQTRFATWVLSALDLTPESGRRVVLVFQTLCDIAESLRAELRERWEDSRFVWIPLQLALTPDQHDSQEALYDLIGRATERRFTEGNRVWYVVNEEFQWEMARSVREAERYHVLWIHDFRGLNGEGKPDAIAFAHTLNYLEALIERVEAYDETGEFPQYFLFLDQHYFEINKSRLWLRVLHEPLDHEPSLPGDRADWEERIRATQERLRSAVASSRLLQLAASQYGESWLRDLIKINVNITNPADPSFWSWHVAGILPIPDNMMRDHRKIAFYDISEEDPYRGLAMFTGMGIGEHYVGAGWEDRALMIQGPGALAVKDAARRLLEAQGFRPEEMPFPFRRQDKPLDYDLTIATTSKAGSPAWLDDPGRVLQLHNETGFHDKPINVAKAMLYSLMPAGSVLEVPDSLWQSYVYASLLAGSALRGCRVVVIAPTADSAPSAAAPTLARAHGLLGRLLVFSSTLEPQTTAQGGLLKVGLYAPRQGVGDLVGRLRQADENRPAWQRQVYPANPAAAAVLEQAPAILDSVGYRIRYLSASDAEEAKPKIHLKANFLASRTAWESLITRPEMADVLREYIVYLGHQTGVQGEDEHRPNVREFPEKLRQSWLRLIRGMIADLPEAERQELVYFLTVGSVNMDYRSMCMDGEAMVTLGGWQSLYGFLDFLLLPGLCEWVETTEQLDALLPPPGGFTRSMAGLLKLSL
jgi:hypothetical protein